MSSAPALDAYFFDAGFSWRFSDAYPATIIAATAGPRFGLMRPLRSAYATLALDSALLVGGRRYLSMDVLSLDVTNFWSYRDPLTLTFIARRNGVDVSSVTMTDIVSTAPTTVVFGAGFAGIDTLAVTSPTDPSGYNALVDNIRLNLNTGI